MKLLIIVLIFGAITTVQEVSACNECHSKNPKMRNMHEALQYKDCFKCHGSGRLKKGEQQKLQMAADPLCTGCHKPKSSS